MATLEDVRAISLDKLVTSSHQARTRDVDKDLDELVHNLQVHGQLEPIIVRQLPGTEHRYEIIAGQRRFLAARKLGWKTLSAAVFEGDIDDATVSAISLSENLVRRDLTDHDLIDVCTKLYRKYGSVKAVSDELGLPSARVRNYVKFDRLRPQLKAMVESGDLDVKSAVRIEDYYGDRDVDSDELKRVASEISGMTNAQQTDYFASGGPVATGDEINGSAALIRKQPRAGQVAQVIVTLPIEVATMLRQWAKTNQSTQDKAAALIIGSFLRGETLAGIGVVLGDR